MPNNQLLQNAKNAIRDLFSDKSVSPATALENFEDLASDIEGYVLCLEAEAKEEAKS